MYQNSKFKIDINTWVWVQDRFIFLVFNNNNFNNKSCEKRYHSFNTSLSFHVPSDEKIIVQKDKL